MGCQLIYLYYCLIFRGKARDRRRNDKWHENGRTRTPGQALLETEIQPAPDPTSPEPAPEPESLPDPALDLTAQVEALAAHNRNIKRRLREAVAVANVCGRALERKREEVEREKQKTDKDLMSMRYHLLFATTAFKQSRENPKRVKLRPTPEEAQAFVAENERKKLEDERWRQRKIEYDLEHQRKSRLDEENFKAQQKKKNAQFERRLGFGPMTELQTRIRDKIYRDADEIAQAHGRNTTFADLREAARSTYLSATATRSAA